MGRLTYEEEYAALQADPATGYVHKKMAAELRAMDPVDAWYIAQALYAMQGQRLVEIEEQGKRLMLLEEKRNSLSERGAVQAFDASDEGQELERLKYGGWGTRERRT